MNTFKLKIRQFIYVTDLEDLLEQKLAYALTAVITLNYSHTSNSFSPQRISERAVTCSKMEKFRAMWREMDVPHQIRHCCLKSFYEQRPERAVFLLQGVTD